MVCLCVAWLLWQFAWFADLFDCRVCGWFGCVWDLVHFDCLWFGVAVDVWLFAGDMILVTLWVWFRLLDCGFWCVVLLVVCDLVCVMIWYDFGVYCGFTTWLYCLGYVCGYCLFDFGLT